MSELDCGCKLVIGGVDTSGCTDAKLLNLLADRSLETDIDYKNLYAVVFSNDIQVKEPNNARFR